ncbi:TadG family pilus assembly protein [Paraburkholderia sp. C35]|uniref:TadG family pilus assembly protein n=1 Tax=Paraburkholderia sp. C35 TaxID=2126993 RepID=UPI000D6909EA|nr:TadG family pilus assembly protein [Paraburkholderia sp. C35]
MSLFSSRRPSPTRSHVRRRPFVSARRQRGATAVLAAVWIGVAVAALGVLDVGNVFLVRRHMQQAADLGAVAGAQTIGMANGCAGATASAQQAAARNDSAAGATVSVTCGRWTTVNGAANFDTSGTTPLNAVQVTATQSVRHFFIGPARDVQAVATAKATDTASFSLTTNLASLSGGAVNSLLSGLLGANVSLDLATYQALASTNVRLGDLATQLGVASINDLLNASTTVSGLASAMVNVLSQNNIASANVISALGTIQAAANGGAKLALGDGGSSAPGLLAIGLADKQAAASSTISALDALIVAAELAHGSSALDLGAALNPTSIPGITLPLSLTLKAAVLEPPVIAVGEAGMDGSGNYRTSAHSAQIRVFFELKVTLLGIAVDLPLALESTSATAGLSTTQCAASKAASTSTIAVKTYLAATCIGADAVLNLTNTTTSLVCNQSAPLANVQVTLPVLGTIATVGVNAGRQPPSPAPYGLNFYLGSQGASTLTFNGQAGDGDDYQTVNTNALGSAASGLLGQVGTQLTQTGALFFTGPTLTSALLTALTPVVQLLLSTLQPVLVTLDTVLVPLLQLLGVQIGVATVHAISLSCSDAQLVN